MRVERPLAAAARAFSVDCGYTTAASCAEEFKPIADAANSSSLTVCGKTSSVASSVHEAGSPSPHARQVFSLDRPLRAARDDFERTYFEFHLANANGNIARVADTTGVERTRLYRKLKRLGLDSQVGRLRKSRTALAVKAVGNSAEEVRECLGRKR